MWTHYGEGQRDPSSLSSDMQGCAYLSSCGQGVVPPTTDPSLSGHQSRGKGGLTTPQNYGKSPSRRQASPLPVAHSFSLHENPGEISISLGSVVPFV